MLVYDILSQFLFQCTQELVYFVGFLFRTVQRKLVCSHIRCIRYGFFTLDNALLLKHVNLENILNNIIELKKIGRVHDNLKQTTRNIQSKVQDI